MKLLFAPLLVLVLLLPLSILATEPASHKHSTQVMYKYTDENNVTIISNTLPPEIIDKGYIILNAYGREQETVAPHSANGPIIETRTKEQLPPIKDYNTLLKMFDSVEEIEQSKQEQIKAIEGIENMALENIKHTQERIEYTKKMITNYQVSNQKVPSYLNERILHHQKMIQENKAFLVRKKIDKQRVEDQYNMMIKDFKTIKSDNKP